jgi:hypothetical protein
MRHMPKSATFSVSEILHQGNSPLPGLDVAMDEALAIAHNRARGPAGSAFSTTSLAVNFPSFLQHVGKRSCRRPTPSRGPGDCPSSPTSKDTQLTRC